MNGVRLAVLVWLLPTAIALASDPAPDAALTTADGKTVHVSEYRGKKAVVVLFMRGFTGDFACYSCGSQTRSYKAAYEKLTAAGAEVLMVLPGATDAAGYLEKVGENDEEHPDPAFEVPFPVLLDSDLSACKAFGVEAEIESQGFPVSNPGTFVIGKDGTMLLAYHGKNPSDRPAVEQVLAVLTGAATPAAGETPPDAAPAKPSLPWMTYEAGMKAAKEQKRPVLIDFYADW